MQSEKDFVTSRRISREVDLALVIYCLTAFN